MIFDFLYIILLILGSPYLLYRFIKRRRWPHHWTEKRCSPKVALPSCDVLVHCVSVGESNAALPLVNKLKEMGKRVVVSVSTATGHEVAVKKYGEENVVFLPYDFSAFVNRFLNRVSPKIVLLMELELWPNLIRQCHKKGIPVTILNGRISKRSLPSYRRFRWALSGTWKKITWFGVQDEEQRERFELAGALEDAVEVTGSVKFDKTPPPSHERVREELGFGGEDFVLVAGSTHKGEEKIILEIYKRINKKHPELKLLLAPRHLERLGEAEGILSQLGLEWKRKSEGKPSSIILLDTMGELFKMYGCADVVIMGGTILPGVEGHDPIEPAVLAKPILFGSYYGNFADITEKLVQGNGLKVVKEIPSELEGEINNLLRNPKAAREMGSQALASVSRHAGAVERYSQKVLELMG